MKYRIGQAVELACDIWDESPDQVYPPGYIARQGETVIIRAINQRSVIYPLSVSHPDVLDNAFGVGLDEIISR